MANTWDQMTFEPLTKFYFYCNVDGQRSELVFDKIFDINYNTRLQCTESCSQRATQVLASTISSNPQS